MFFQLNFLRPSKIAAYYICRYVLVMYVCRFILHAKKTAFVVEHDFIMATYLADRVIVYDGSPGIDTRANS